ncbi:MULTISPECIES: hypothetical protein [unclassified Caballeronia]|nr:MULTISPECIES: hypothetical protein [unclassified Caballeronia]
MTTSQAVVLCVALSPVIVLIAGTAAKVIASIVRDRRYTEQS